MMYRALKVKSAEINIEKEILIVDDGSTDGTRDLLNEMRDDPELKIEFMDENVGRGGVIKHLWKKLTGDIVIHQDADLEYNPAEYQQLLNPLLNGDADVVYGSRFKGSIEKMHALNNLGNRAMTLMTRLLHLQKYRRRCCETTGPGTSHLRCRGPHHRHRRNQPRRHPSKEKQWSPVPTCL